MGRIIYLPFENLPQRYTSMWNWAIFQELTKDDIVVNVNEKENLITSGEFLDTYSTIEYKAQQIEKVSNLFKAGVVKDGDIFYVPDVFFPGLSSIKYMSELAGIKVKIASFNHAGRADKDDFVQRLGNWSDTQERSWHQMCDLVMVGSNYHANRVRQKFNVHPITTGAIWSSQWMNNICKDISKVKEWGTVIWPHRPCKEKRFDLMLQIAKVNPGIQFYITSGGNSRIDTAILPKNVFYYSNLTKRKYYEIFARCDGYLSTAYQETFGYTVQEAIYFGCKIICPDYACYPEYVDKSSIVSFTEMQENNFLTDAMESRNLRKSTQMMDNAKYVVNLIRNM